MGSQKTPKFFFGAFGAVFSQCLALPGGVSRWGLGQKISKGLRIYGGCLKCGGGVNAECEGKGLQLPFLLLISSSFIVLRLLMTASHEAWDWETQHPPLHGFVASTHKVIKKYLPTNVPKLAYVAQAIKNHKQPQTHPPNNSARLRAHPPAQN